MLYRSNESWSWSTSIIYLNKLATILSGIFTFYQAHFSCLIIHFIYSVGIFAQIHFYKFRRKILKRFFEAKIVKEKVKHLLNFYVYVLKVNSFYFREEWTINFLMQQLIIYIHNNQMRFITAQTITHHQQAIIDSILIEIHPISCQIIMLHRT